MAEKQKMFVLSSKLNMCLVSWFPSKEAVLGRGVWLGDGGARCSSRRRGSRGAAAAGSPALAWAALCATGKVSLLSTLAQIKESQGQQNRRRA